ncbi:MAG: hypothetical protein LAN36_10030 [Acidobacteriia bacterium]|nr:hypothetical protein [Terriglobia bacterium]
MTRLQRLVFLVAAALILAPLAGAQNDSEPAPLALGDFNLSGSATAGYRFDTVKGYEPKFRELFNLRSGFRLLDLNLYGESREGKNPFADSLSLQTTSLGGDPFPTAQFTISKKKVYDFRANWRQSYYFWNQNDNVVLPIVALAPAALSKNGKSALTNNHDWNTVRKFGSVDFTLHATNNLRFNFNYYRPSDEGITVTTRSPDFFGDAFLGNSFGGYARANPYQLEAPISDYTNRFTGGFDYTVKDWTFHYSIGYQTFTENSALNIPDGVSLPVHSINPVTDLSPGNPSANTVSNFSITQSRRLTTPISEFSFVGKPLSKLEWRGGYMYYRYQGPMSFDQAYNGTAPTSTSAQTPYTVSESARATLTQPNHVLTQGLTYHLYRWWSFDVGYKYSRFTSDSIGHFQSLFQSSLDGTTPTTATTDVIWRDGLSDLNISMAFTPMHGLVIRPGIQLMKSDVESLTNGVVNAGLTLRTKTARPEISFGYEPSKLFSIRGDFHSMTSGASYTAITPHTQQGTRFVLRFHPIERLSVEDEVSFVNNKLLATNFENNLRSNAITVSYSLNDRLSVFGGFSYDSYYAQGDIQYVRGTAPLNDFLRDQEVNRVWSGGIEAKPTKRTGLRLTGNFDRSTGTGAISGVPPASSPNTYNEPPAYGPMTWPLVTGTVYGDLPFAGRIAVDLQRTYYSEQIVRVNNFSANLLTIRWTKSF